MRRFIIAALAACTVLLLAAPAQAHRDASISYIDEALELTPRIDGGRWGGECGKGSAITCYTRSEMDPVAYKSDFDHDGDYTSGNHSYQFKGAFWEKKGEADCRRVTIRANVEGHRFEVGTHDEDHFPRVWHDGAYSRDNGDWIIDDPDRCPALGGGSGLASLQDNEEDTPGTATDACYVNPGRYYTATCPGDNGDSYTPPAGWDVTEAIGDPPLELVPDAITYGPFIYGWAWDNGYSGTTYTAADVSYVSPTTDSSDVAYINDNDNSEYDGQIDFGLSNTPSGSSGTYTAVVYVHLKQAYATSTPVYLSLVSSTGTPLGTTTASTFTDKLVNFQVTGLSASALDGANVRVYKDSAGLTPTEIRTIDVLAYTQ